MTLQLCLSIIMTPSSSAFLEFSEYTSGLDLAAITEAQATELMTKMGELMAPMMIFMAVEFIIKLFAGFLANPLYKNYTVTRLREIEAAPDRRQKLANILKFGGVSPLMPLAAYFAEQMLLMLAGMFF